MEAASGSRTGTLAAVTDWLAAVARTDHALSVPRVCALLTTY